MKNEKQGIKITKNKKGDNVLKAKDIKKAFKVEKLEVRETDYDYRPLFKKGKANNDADFKHLVFSNLFTMNQTLWTTHLEMARINLILELLAKEKGIDINSEISKRAKESAEKIKKFEEEQKKAN